MRSECRLKGWNQLLKLVERETREIQELRRARLHIGKLYTGYGWCLLSWEAQYTINRDNLTFTPCLGKLLEVLGALEGAVCHEIGRAVGRLELWHMLTDELPK